MNTGDSMQDIRSKEQMQIILSLSKIYTSVYYIDLVNNYFKELSSLSDVHTHIGEAGDAQERLNYFCRNMAIADYTEELLKFVDLSTLEQRLGSSRIISKPYQSSLFVSPETGKRECWALCSFIEGDRDADGRLSHVIFVT